MQWDDEILNVALEMSLEWGHNLTKPINARLIARYPALSEAEATNYDQVCREIKSYAFDQIEAAYVQRIPWHEARQSIMGKYPGLSEDSYLRLNSQGHYYAWRNNG
ncbi:MAG TPA: hypothetical protein VF600_16685 [Abditibacteriaceae bacterium]|jgi:hypothetical protein